MKRKTISWGYKPGLDGNRTGQPVDSGEEPLSRTFTRQWVRVRCPSYSNEVSQLFDDMIHNAWGRPTWSPNIDIAETAGSFVVKIDLPGVAPDKVTIKTQPDSIMVTGYRQSLRQSCSSIITLHIGERGSGHFAREIHFRHPVDMSTLQTELVDGVLTITVAKCGKEND